jgi:hypothetical protein
MNQYQPITKKQTYVRPILGKFRFRANQTFEIGLGQKLIIKKIVKKLY